MIPEQSHGPARSGWQSVSSAFALARGLWIVTIALTVAVYVLEVPWQFANFRTVCSAAPCPDGQLTADGLQLLQQGGLSLDFYAGYLTTLNAGFVLVFVIVAAVIFWRKSNDWIGIYTSLAMALFGITFSSNLLLPLPGRYPILTMLAQAITVVGSASFNTLLYIFPDGRFVPRWTRWLVPLVILREVVRVFRAEQDAGWYFYLEVGRAYWRRSSVIGASRTRSSASRRSGWCTLWRLVPAGSSA